MISGGFKRNIWLLPSNIQRPRVYQGLDREFNLVGRQAKTKRTDTDSKVLFYQSYHLVTVRMRYLDLSPTPGLHAEPGRHAGQRHRQELRLNWHGRGVFRPHPSQPKFSDISGFK